MSMSRRFTLAACAAAAISLPVAAADSAESLCTAPGITVLTDPAGDADPGGLGVGLPVDSEDLVSLQVAQPEQADGIERLVFTLKVSSFATPMLPMTSWFSSFKSPDKRFHAVRMITDQMGTPAFQSYVVKPGDPTVGSADPNGDFAEDGSIKPAEAESNFKDDGTITIVVKVSELGVKTAGSEIKDFSAYVANQFGNDMVATLSSTADAMPDDGSRSGSITTTGNAPCKGLAAKAGLANGSTFGGALNPALLLPLMLLAARRRRR